MHRTPGLIFCVVLVCAASAGAARAAECFGTKRGKVYHTHRADCPSAKKIQDENIITFATEDEAKAAGRRLCRRCEQLDQRGATKPAPKPPENSAGGGDKPVPRSAGDATRVPIAPGGQKVASAPLPEFAKVTKVLDGGTLVLDIGENAVLAGVSFPRRGQPADASAIRFLTEQTRGRSVRLEFEPGGGDDRDELGRLLVYATPEPDGRDLGGELLFQGYAWLDRARPFSRRIEYLRFEEEAWRGRRGIWEQGNDPGGETVVTGRRATCYHRPDCEHVRHLVGVTTMTLMEAKARRLVPCSEYRVPGKTATATGRRTEP